jgi:hypothetical protein
LRDYNVTRAIRLSLSLCRARVRTQLVGLAALDRV